MRYLVVSYAFLPSVGGQETASETMARELVRRGHQVVVVTATPSPVAGMARASTPYRIVRRPGVFGLLALHRWADAVIHNGFSLRLAWPLLLLRRPFLAIHLMELPAGRWHRWMVRRARNVAVSRYIADTLPVPAAVVPNAYRDDVFRPTNARPRRYDLIFVGRLVSLKGADVLLDALGLLAGRGVRPSLVVVGSGDREGALRAQAGRLGLDALVNFVGSQDAAAVAALLNDSRILVVPSRWQEPFGIVALEGIACGCAVIGARAGGLPEAIGPCGLTVAMGDAAALADAIARLLTDEAAVAGFRAQAPAHLARHTPGAIVESYLAVLGRAS